MTVHFGVVALGHVLGDPVDVAAAAPDYTDDVDRVLGWGFRTFHRAQDGVGLTDLAAEAGAKALGDAGVQPHEVDLVVLAMSDLSEHLYWDAAGATQAKIGAHGSENVLLTQACGGGVAAFDVVAGKFATHPDYQTALIIGANRVCEPYWNRMEINTSIFSDGAAAAVVRRDHPRNRWLNTEIISDGRYADFMMMDVGAAARPFAGQQDVGVKSPQKRLEEFFAGDIRKMFEFVSTIRTNNHEVVRRSCRRAGIEPADLRKLLHLHDSVPAMTLLAKDLDHGPEWTNTEVSQAYGHVGCADQLMSLEHYLTTEELTEGDVVALTSTASGMHWLCTLLAI